MYCIMGNCIVAALLLMVFLLGGQLVCNNVCYFCKENLHCGVQSEQVGFLWNFERTQKNF